MNLGDKVRNIAVSDDNPIKFGVFVRYLYGGECEYATTQGVQKILINKLALQPDNFKDALYSMSIGERISSDDKKKYGINWIVTRVPGGWIYTAEVSKTPISVFVPYSDEFSLPY